MNKSKGKGIEGIFPFLLMSGLFILIDSLALLVISPFEAAGISAFENHVLEANRYSNHT